MSTDHPETNMTTAQAPAPLTPATMKMHGRYNWKHQPERLVYIGRNWSGNGYWHQFELVNKPGKVWCEVVDADLPALEETVS